MRNSSRTTFQTKKKYGSFLGRVPFGLESYFETNDLMIKIRRVRQNEIEQNIIQLINMMYFGIRDIKDFYKIFQKLTNNLNYKLIDSNNNEFKQICYKNFTMKTIVDFLNENNILNRNKKWNVNMLNSILNKTENFLVNNC